MIDWFIRQLFKSDRLRSYVFAEVDWYNSITRTLQDPDAMKVATAFWCEPDGWRGWTIKDDGKYFFNDVAEPMLLDIMEILDEQERLDNGL